LVTGAGTIGTSAGSDTNSVLIMGANSIWLHNGSTLTSGGGVALTA
jgi:hypothetical protein